jgi:hypothetical protein
MGLTDKAKDLADAARITFLLHRAGAIEISLADLAGPHEHIPQAVGIASNRREHDGAALDEHHALIVAQRRHDAERSGLPAQVEQLEDVVDSELAQRSFDRHR